ncbi:RING domain containing protein (plasmid) [Cardinium endosymbiont cEper1 of Encarsia pergandiella]|uniref:ankyrin repeat domain-containing protein n=1 Tax=Cardinium endosymbiont of Encarsia pergandiella TaxID=249402 RepID=UPI00027E9E1D|nr:ankyrin repeat domain-containing protein [Cardinium endosymbiont of Encarsia pergandiella]CCM10649.1 RING domain containing protein [Cardinium endosymbiont cEper1 of Encarsia pergandiella]
MKQLHYLFLFFPLAAIDCTGCNKTSKSINNLKHKKCSYEKNTINSNKYVDVDVDVDKKDRRGYTALYNAVRFNDIDKARFLLKSGSDPNIAMLYGSILEKAVSKKNVEMVKLLLSYGAYIIVQEDGSSTILDCFRHKSNDRSKEIYQLLVNSLSPEERDRVNKKSKEDVNSLDSIGYTPLHWAVVDNNLKEAKRLLELGADPNVVVNGSSTPIYISVQNQNKEMVRLLLSHGAEVYYCDEKTNPVFMSYDIELMDIILTHLADSGKKDFEGLSPIHWACRDGRLSLVKYILNNDSSLINDSNNLYNFTPLHWAARGGFKDMVSFLISKGANKTAKSRSNFTPLMLAISNNHEQFRSILSPDDAQIETENSNTDSEQCSICLNTMGRSDCIIFPSTQIECGHTFHFECIAGYVANKLSTYPWVRCPNCRNKISEGLCNSMLSSSNPTRNESLIEAVKQSNYEVTSLLLSCEADPNHFDSNTRMTPLHYAARNMSNGKARQDILDKICMILIQHGAKVNAIDSGRKTARDYIPSYNEALTVLVESGGMRSGYCDHPKTAFGLPVRKDK